MSPSIVNAVKNLLDSRFDNLTFLMISWYGGEPLLSLDTIAALSEHIELRLCTYPKVRYKASMTTNGYLLTPNVFQKLLKWGVSTYQISFDGLKEHHDRKRILVNGNPTFDRLWSNLKEMKSFSDNFSVTVRLHVDQENIGESPDFLKLFAQDFGHDSRFSAYVMELGQYSNSPRQDLRLLSPKDSRHAMKDICRLAESLHIPVRVPDRESHDSYITCFAAKLNSFIIRSNGQISKCIVALDNDANQVGTINEDGTLILDRMKLLAWARGFSSGATQELECPLRDIDNSNKHSKAGSTGS